MDSLIKLGHNILVVDDFSNGHEENLQEAKNYAASNGLELDIKRASLSDPSVWSGLEACEAIFHTASHTSVVHSVSHPGHDFQSNIDPIPYILKYVRQNNVKFFLMASSGGTVYGDASFYPTDERALVSPLSPHGVTKAFFELYLKAWSSALKQVGDLQDDPKKENFFSWVSLRLGNVYGPRQHANNDGGVIPLFIEELMSGKQPVIFGDGNKTRDYIYVADVVEAFLRAFEEMQILSIDEVFNVATGKETKDSDVLTTVVAALKAQYPNLKNLHEKAKMQSKRPGEVQRSLLDTNKISALLSWMPRVDFADGVRATVADYVATHDD